MIGLVCIAYCPYSDMIVCRRSGQCQYCGKAFFHTERIAPGDKTYELIEQCESMDDMFAWREEG